MIALQTGQWIEAFNFVLDALPWLGAAIAAVVVVFLVIKNKPPE